MQVDDAARDRIMGCVARGVGGIPLAVFLAVMLWALVALTCYGLYELLT